MLQFNCYKTSTVLVMKWFLVHLKHLTDIHWYECIPFIVSECDWNICDSLLLFSPSIITHLYTQNSDTHSDRMTICMCCAVPCRAYISIYLYSLNSYLVFGFRMRESDGSPFSLLHDDTKWAREFIQQLAMNSKAVEG